MPSPWDSAWLGSWEALNIYIYLDQKVNQLSSQSSMWVSYLSINAKKNGGARTGSFIEGGFEPGHEPCKQPSPFSRIWSGERG